MCWANNTSRAPRPPHSFQDGAQLRLLSQNDLVRDHFFAGDAGAAGEGAAFAAGDELALVDGAGVPAGFAASVPAGRKPRLPGLFNILAAKLLTIFASDSATVNKAAFKISFR